MLMPFLLLWDIFIVLSVLSIFFHKPLARGNRILYNIYAARRPAAGLCGEVV